MRVQQVGGKACAWEFGMMGLRSHLQRGVAQSDDKNGKRRGCAESMDTLKLGGQNKRENKKKARYKISCKRPGFIVTREGMD